MGYRLFPALSPDALHAASGGGEPPVGEFADIKVDGDIVSRDGAGAVWAPDNRRIYFSAHSFEGLKTWAFGETERLVDGPLRIGGNTIATSSAPGREVAISRTDPPRILFSGGEVLEGFTTPGFSDDGKHFACLRHDDAALFLNGRAVTIGGRELPGCSLPRFGSTSLAWEMPGGRIFGIADCNNPDLVSHPMELTVPGLKQYKPCPVWVAARGILLLTNHSDDALLLQVWGIPNGWELWNVARQGNLDQGFHHARPLGAAVRVLATSSGRLLDIPFPLSTDWYDLRPKAAPAPGPAPTPTPTPAPTPMKASITITDYHPTSGPAPLTWEATATTTGEIDRIVWRWRRRGDQSWTKKDDDQHTTVVFTQPGVYEIGVDAYDAAGRWLDGTASQRLITVETPVVIPPPSPPPAPPRPLPEPPSDGALVTALTTNGPNFMEGDRIWKYIGMTAFTLFQDFCEGKDITPFVRWARSIGCNIVRVFGCWGVNGTMFDIRRYGDAYYDLLWTFCVFLANERMRLHFVCYTDQVPGSGVMLDSFDAQVNHHARVMEELAQSPIALLEDINEFDFNGKLVLPSATPAGLLRTRSSWVDGSTPDSVGGLLHWTSEHTPRGAQSSRKAKNLFETSRQGLGSWGPSRLPAVGGEPDRFENWGLRDIESYYAIAMGMGSGAALHSGPDLFQRCNIPQDQALLDRVATFTSIVTDPPPADLHAIGNYTRGGLGDCPLEHHDRYGDNNDGDNEVDSRGTRRTYALLAGDRGAAIANDPGKDWMPIGAHGWRVGAAHGSYGLWVDVNR